MKPDTNRKTTGRNAPDSSDRTANRSETGPPTGRRATVQEAAETLGITVEAVRARVRRGTLRKEKGEDGTVYVWLEAGRIADRARRESDQLSNRPRPGEDRINGLTEQDRVQTDQARSDALVEALRDQVEILRAELEDRKEEARRRDAIIMSLSQRLPELPPAPSREAPGTLETAPEGEGEVPSGAQDPPRRRSWLYRFFFGP